MTAELNRWKPTATIENLRRRAQVLSSIRLFFSERNVLEVETPSLSGAASSEQHLDSFAVVDGGRGHAADKFGYLHTSPEYPMKRLLAAGSGDIFQLAKVFRRGELGRWHNPEFTLLEWYRMAYDWRRLAVECGQLLSVILGTKPPELKSYAEIWHQYSGQSYQSLSADSLRTLLLTADVAPPAACSAVADLADLYFSTVIQPKLGRQLPLVLHDYPAEQASLAALGTSADGKAVALRFEIFWQGVELGNGFEELCDPAILEARFSKWNQQRLAAGKDLMPLDRHLIAALESGLPPCAGVAIGVDRLVALVCNAEAIADVISFSSENA